MWFQNSSLSLIPWGALVQESHHRVCSTQRQGDWAVTLPHQLVTGCKLGDGGEKGREEGYFLAPPVKVAPPGNPEKKDPDICC